MADSTGAHGAGTYEFGPESGRVVVKTRREGLAARAGHDLTLEITDWLVRVTAPGEAVAVALKLAEQLTLNAPLALTAVKKMVRTADGVPEADAFTVQRKVFADLMASADVREGMTAFAERRAPQWKGK